MRRLPAFLAGALLLSVAALALAPAVDGARARREARRALDTARDLLVSDDPRTLPRLARAGACFDDGPLAIQADGTLASWGSVGGCGAGGGSASAAGGLRWVGRNVTGGLVDVQCFPSQTRSRSNGFTTINTRLGTSQLTPWAFGLNVPVLYKTGQVTVLGATRTARIAGFGDLGLEVSRKLGVSGAHQLTLVASAPTGAWDAVRQGVVLPQRLQLGSGVPGLTSQYEHTHDHDWGLIIFGGTASYGGWQNGIGDRRSPSATAYTYAGYLAGPLVPSAGLLLFGKPMHDRERHAALPDDADPLALVVPTLGLEWSSDWLALFLTANVGLSYNGFESVTVGLGASSSLF